MVLFLSLRVNLSIKTVLTKQEIYKLWRGKSGIHRLRTQAGYSKSGKGHRSRTNLLEEGWKRKQGWRAEEWPLPLESDQCSYQECSNTVEYSYDLALMYLVLTNYITGSPTVLTNYYLHSSTIILFKFIFCRITHLLKRNRLENIYKS